MPSGDILKRSCVTLAIGLCFIVAQLGGHILWDYPDLTGAPGLSYIRPSCPPLQPSTCHTGCQLHTASSSSATRWHRLIGPRSRRSHRDLNACAMSLSALTTLLYHTPGSQCLYSPVDITTEPDTCR